MLICFNMFIWGNKFLTSITLCKLLKSFTIPNLRKMEITIDFNGNLIHLCSVITDRFMNVAETFTDTLKHYFLQRNVGRFAKCMLQRITLNYYIFNNAIC